MEALVRSNFLGRAEQDGRKHRQMACPRTCVEMRVFHDRRDDQDGHAPIHHDAPGDNSPRDAGYIFADEESGLFQQPRAIALTAQLMSCTINRSIALT